MLEMLCVFHLISADVGKSVSINIGLKEKEHQKR